MLSNVSRMSAIAFFAMSGAVIALNAMSVGAEPARQGAGNQVVTPDRAPPNSGRQLNVVEHAQIPAPSDAPISIPDDAKLTLLIQLHMAALAIGNLTGEYAQLHALGTPEFKSATPVALLGEKFRNFRQASLDISPILLQAPILYGRPKILKNNRLLLSGFYNTLPQNVQFSIEFQAHESAWRLSGLGVQLATPAPAALSNAAVLPPDAVPKRQNQAKQSGGRPTKQAKN